MTLGTTEATGTIVDDDMATVSVSSASAEEGEVLEFTVTQSVQAVSDTVLGWSTSPFTATPGDDFTVVTTGTLRIAAGDTAGTLRVSTVEDAVVEGNETFTVTITGMTLPPGVTLGTTEATGTIVDDEAETISYDDSFTDSTGRTLLYRYWVRSDWDLAVPRGVVLSFHGNNRGTAEELRQGWGRGVYKALDQGLAVVVPASPYSRPEELSFGEETLVPEVTGSGGTRFWAPEDARLVHELLQSNLNSRLAIDHDRVVFSGGSQGTCFLATFVEFYGGSYGGGFHAWCGCFWLDFDGADSHDTYAVTPPFLTSPWRPTFQWTPFAASVVRDRLKVFVEATTEDFLYPAAVSMSRYYSEWLGLETRTDLEMAGGHCSVGVTPVSEVFDWLSSGAAPAHPGTSDDTDGDGTPNQFDLDDDNDGAPDFIDALPDDARDWRDTDRDGIADAMDRDADGDGVSNAVDVFPLDFREWRDTDADGIGNELDDDDDNDGLPDTSDPQPLVGRDDGRLAFVNRGRAVSGYTGQLHFGVRAHVRAGRPAGVVYPPSHGHSQSYQFLELGNGADARFEVMVDSFVRPESCPAVLLPQLCDVERYSWSGYYSSYLQDQFFRIWIDRNRNRDLTDDGPPLLSAVNRERPIDVSTTEAILEVPYSSGHLLPYAIAMAPTPDDLTDGLKYYGTSVWRGEVVAPSGGGMLAIAVDGNLDGLFDSRGDAMPEHARDFVCLDLDRDGWLNECDFTEDADGLRMRPGAILPSEPFDLDGGRYSLSVAPWGREITIVEH